MEHVDMSTPISTLQDHQPQFPPNPEVQQAPAGTFYNQMQQQMQQQMHQGAVPSGAMQTQYEAEKPVETESQAQKEMMFLFFIVLVVSSEPVQRQLVANFPSLFNDSKTSIVATAINAGVICGMFYVAKNVKINISE